ncbi:hypothetical protein SALBM311S_11910 [Streptomyces alboniger]
MRVRYSLDGWAHESAIPREITPKYGVHAGWPSRALRPFLKAATRSKVGRLSAFLAVGRGFRIGFTTTDPAWQIGLESVTEGRWGRDGWKAERRLNGDETAGGTAWMHPRSGQISASPFPIPAPCDHSGISRCRIYRFPSREAPALD